MAASSKKGRIRIWCIAQALTHVCTRSNSACMRDSRNPWFNLVVKEATTTRFKLLRFAFALSIVTYIDRVCISSADTAVSKDLHLSKDEMGWVFGAFTLAYAVFEIPSGRMGDWIGPRKVLTRIVLWWSAFTAATGLAWN